MDLKAYRFWPNGINGKPLSGRIMIVVVLIGVILGQMSVGDPAQFAYVDKYLGPGVVFGFILVMGLFLCQKKKPDA